MNPEAKAFIVDIAPYRSADPRTFYIYGWSDTVLSYIAQSIQGYDTLVERIARMDLEGEE
ncbi:hypothetical protein [Paenibacillus humicus]|uniref:hypothetical protein n=1 Tax=Paenibacillus humicus TaxID=412861 RepID=UPI0035A22DEF